MTAYPRLITWRLAAAALVPAALAAALVLALVPGSPDRAPVSLPLAAPARAAELAQAAGRAEPRELEPIVLENNHVTLGFGPAGPLTTHGRPEPPRDLNIPALGVHAQITPVGTTPHGIAVPPIHRAGWWEEGPRPGEAGRAVVIGHLDSPTGPDVFGRVPALKNGAEITVTDTRGGTHPFRVVGKLEIQKRRFPTSAVYGPSPRPVLVLITCGGPYIPGFGYRDNVIVYARSVARGR